MVVSAPELSIKFLFGRLEGRWFRATVFTTLLKIIYLHQGVYMGTGDTLLGVALGWICIPSRGEVKILQVASKLQLCGPLKIVV